MLLNKYIVHGFQLAGVAIMLFIVLIPRTLQLDSNAWPQWLHSLYLSCGKVFFVLGMYLTILPSLLDIKNMTFFLMDTEFFNFVAKVSFWTYLIHYMVVLQITYRQKIDFYYSVGDIVPIYIPTAIISIFLGFIGTIVVEMPFGKMEKMLMNMLMGRKDINRKVNKVGSLTEPLTQSMKDTIDSSSLKDSLPPDTSVHSTIITKDSIQT
jgi:peptidoglycan/LPS O-acetylase OafA/YrhL